MKKILLFFVALTIVLTTVAWIRYGGGEPYPDLSSAPVLSSSVINNPVTLKAAMFPTELLVT